VTNFYDDSGRVAEQRDGTSPPGITCFHYEIKDTYSGSNCPNPNPPPGQQQTIMVDPRGYKTTYTTDSQFRIAQVTNHLKPSLILN